MARGVQEVRRIQVDAGGKIDSRATQETLDEHGDVINTIVRNPLVDAVLIENITFTKDAFTDVQHGLGRAPKGWIQVSAKGLVTLLEIERTDKSKFIRLEGSFHHPTETAKVNILCF